ncbi:MAG: hypothetical protein AMXMBFR53_41290 [Gemmatimonadota bacterium]
MAAVRELVRAHIPEGYEEAVSYGMLVWEVPLERVSDTYNGQPLGYVGLAAQKVAAMEVDEFIAAYEEGHRRGR